MSSLSSLANDTIDMSRQAMGVYNNELKELDAARLSISEKDFQNEYRILNTKVIFMQFIVANCGAVIQSIAKQGHQTIEAF
jgi:hypothetical protein